MELHILSSKKTTDPDGSVVYSRTLRYHYDDPKFHGFQFLIDILPSDCDLKDEAAVLVIGNRRARDMVKNWLAAKRVVMQSEPDNGVVGKVAVPD